MSNVQVRRFPWLRLCIVQSSNPICSNMRNLLILLLFTGICTVQAQPFKQDIQSFLREDSAKPPAAGQVLFVGSSSFRMWQDVQTYFPTVPIINRGFGGSTLKDVIYYEKQIIAPYKPRKIVIYCGENDFAESDTVEATMVLERFKTLFAMIRQDLPGVPVIFVSIKPSPSRQHLMPKMALGNQLIKRFLRKQKKTAFVDVYHKMLNTKGEPRPELFLEDKLHMNRQGYLIWQKALAPLLAK